MHTSFIIPTVDRAKDLERLLKSFGNQTKKPHEIIIVEQGNVTSKELVEKFSSLHIKYFKVDFISLTKARNFGIEKSAGDVVGFLDDDIILDEKYVEKIEDFFRENPDALGVQGVITNFEEGHTKKVGGNTLVYKMYNFLAKIFLLNNSSTKNRLLLSGRNQYASRVEKITNCEWLSGIGNYRKIVFEEFTFDESLKGYALGEDKLFSYPIFEKYPTSLFVDPEITCEHHHADSGRPKDKKWVEMKITYTYYLWTKLFKKRGLQARLAYIWANIGDMKIVFFLVLLRQNSFKFYFWHVKGYWNLIWKKNISL
mgnify:CR=1 FL=1